MLEMQQLLPKFHSSDHHDCDKTAIAKNSWNVSWSEATLSHCQQFLGEARIDSIIGVSLEVMSISKVKTEMFTSST